MCPICPGLHPEFWDPREPRPSWLDEDDEEFVKKRSREL